MKGIIKLILKRLKIFY